MKGECLLLIMLQTVWVWMMSRWNDRLGVLGRLCSVAGGNSSGIISPCDGAVAVDSPLRRLADMAVRRGLTDRDNSLRAASKVTSRLFDILI
jgi:hypothetical protein